MAFDFSQAVKNALNRLATYYNAAAYNSASNPGGYDNDGHRINFIPTLQDIASVITAVAVAATDAQASASTASDKAAAANTAATNAGTAAGAADLSRANAASAQTLSRLWATQPSGEVETGKGFSALYWAQRAADLVQQATGGAILPSGGSFAIGNLLSFAATDGRSAKDTGLKAAEVLTSLDALARIATAGPAYQKNARDNIGAASVDAVAALAQRPAGGGSPGGPLQMI